MVLNDSCDWCAMVHCCARVNCDKCGWNPDIQKTASSASGKNVSWYNLFPADKIFQMKEYYIRAY